MATKKTKSWGYSPSRPARPAKPQVSALIKSKVEEQAQQLIETFLKPTYIKPAPQETEYNYLVDIYGKWYRSYFYFCGKYACPSANATAPFFETKFARMEFTGGGGLFNLAFLRHTGQWYEIAQDLSLDACLTSIKDDPFFQP